MKNEWVPILFQNSAITRGDDYLESIVRQKLSDIADLLVKESNNFIYFPGLFNGISGVVLFLTYYFRFSGDEKYYRCAIDLIEKIISRIQYEFTDASFSNGLSGIGWAIRHMVQNELLEIDENMFEDLDPYLDESMLLSISDSRYEMFQGAIGISKYYSDWPIDNRSYRVLVELIGYLDRSKVMDKSGCGFKWKYIVDSTKQKDEIYNLGLAHGIPSLIVFLSHLYQKGVEKETVGFLVKGAVEFLVSQRWGQNHSIQNPDDLSLFPNFVYGDNERSLSSNRMAWCNGDLGIAFALYRAGNIFGNKMWEQEALDIFAFSFQRKKLKENMVVDACFCHGTSGIAHLFNRMYHYTGIEEYKQNAIYWLEETLKMDQFPDGLAGYKARLRNQGEEVIWGNEIGILKGIAGIGFAMMSIVSSIEPHWDSCLMLS